MIREATAADLDALCALQAPCFPDDPWTRGMLSEELGRGGGIFLVDMGAAGPTGWAIGWNVLGELHVLQVAVRPDARRSGAGRRLVVELEGRALGAETAWLEVRTDNAAAIGLYASAGYVAVGRRPRYYADGCDALLMRKSLAVTSSGPRNDSSS
jgi:ribosomal-protein-alanine acetyltransferase